MSSHNIVFCFLTYFGLSHAHVSAFHFETALVFHRGLSLWLARLSCRAIGYPGKAWGPAPTPGARPPQTYPLRANPLAGAALVGLPGIAERTSATMVRELGKTTTSCITHKPEGFHSTGQLGEVTGRRRSCRRAWGAAPIRGERDGPVWVQGSLFIGELQT